ncbi:MAG: hypothetical protein ACYDHD_01720 [Vulcanimicrobiaceae bacterium]
MNSWNWRTLLPLGAAVIVIAVIINIAIVATWVHGTSAGAYGNGEYGPMMGPWMWSGMGFFWIYPIIGFLFIMMLIAIVGRAFFGEQARPLPADWVVCPYCGTRRNHSESTEIRPASDELENR